MAALEVIALDTSVPQLMAPQAGDTYTFPRAVEMPLGTANGVLFLNGSKVVTSGSALTFDGTNLGVGGTSGYETANRTTIAAVGVNSALLGFKVGGTSAGYAFADASHVEFGAPTGRYLSWDINGEQMRLTSTGLGIGTSSPNAPIHIIAADAATADLARFQQTNQGNLLIQSQQGGQSIGASNGILFSNSTGNMGWRTNASTGSANMVLDSSGNLGLGVTPSAWNGLKSIDVFGSTAGSFASSNGSASISINAYYNGTDWIYKGNGFATRYEQLGGGGGTSSHSWHTAAVFGTAGNAISFSQVMTLDASGNFSVGTTTTPSQITFAGSSGITYQRSTDNAFAGVLDYLKSRGSAASPTAVQNNDGLFQLRVAPFQGSAYTYLDSQIVSVDGTFTSGQNPPTRIAWFTNTANGSPTERARIPAAGGMVVGTAALATAATDGFLYVPTCAGTPTGTPTTQTGTAPIVVDTTNNKLYFYSGGQWRDAGP
jgi:hypothetical protein